MMQFQVKVVVLSGSVDQKLMEWDPSNPKKDSVKKGEIKCYFS